MSHILMSVFEVQTAQHNLNIKMWLEIKFNVLKLCISWKFYDIFYIGTILLFLDSLEFSYYLSKKITICFKNIYKSLSLYTF